MAQPATATAPSLALDTPQLAETYDRVSDKQYEHGKLLIASLAIAPGQRVLDVGSGTGRLGEYVAREIVGPTGQVHAIDPLPLRIELARKRASPNHLPAVGRSDDLSAFADQSFDIVFLNSVYHWLPEKLPTLREAFRVLKPGGRIGISVASRERPHELRAVLQAAVNAAGATLPTTTGSTPFTVSAAELATQHEQAGFLVDEIRLRVFDDLFASPEEVIAFSESSSFGNFLSEQPAEVRPRLHTAYITELEKRRTTAGIRLQRRLLFSVASKPS
ncbi:2-heptaprenyl-1,4-naphthoquinone methyltransferase [Planctomycetota bacterium]|nr:2-heptaprenyl-1,4-naphthoquinone methyltransferase [Planctomycetota bacterium]